MRNYLPSTAVAVAMIAVGATAQAFPVPPRSGLPTDNVIEVRNGCGLGWHLGPYGVCHRNGVFPYAYGTYAAYAPPSYYPGRCWWTGTVYGPRRVCAW
jgi:hypothetical protein